MPKVYIEFSNYVFELKVQLLFLDQIFKQLVFILPPQRENNDCEILHCPIPPSPSPAVQAIWTHPRQRAIARAKSPTAAENPTATSPVALGDAALDFVVVTLLLFPTVAVEVGTGNENLGCVALGSYCPFATNDCRLSM
jgi:hypothetical protein